MRIISGLHRGATLLSPKAKNVRPTSARAREALFNIFQPRIEGARFLDLFGGVGAIGLEAVSRGAGRVVIVEKTEGALIEKNIKKLKLYDSGIVELIKSDVITACNKLSATGELFDIVFADPPWNAGLEETAISCADRLLAGDGLFVLEAFHKTEIPDSKGSCLLTESRKYGDTTFHFFKKKSGQSV